MPACIYLSGMAGSGKTAIALAMAVKLQEKGYRTAYFKPQGFQKIPSKREDDDIQLMKNILSIPFSSEIISPVALNPLYLSSTSLEGMEDALKKLDQAYQKLSQNCDVLLIEGSITPYLGKCYQMDDYSLAKRWNATLLQVIKADDDFELDNSLSYLDVTEAKDLNSLGCIFNNVTEEQWDTTTNLYQNLVEEMGVTVLGVLPRRTELATPTAREFYKSLGGELLAGKDYLNRKVENVLVGTMNIESALTYLRRSANKAVITGGDRSDMALTAMETSTSALILTGGLSPDVKVLSQAEEKKIPVILVHYDTFTTVENLSGVYRTIHPDNQESLQLLQKDTEIYLDLSPVYKYVKDNTGKE